MAKNSRSGLLRQSTLPFASRRTSSTATPSKRRRLADPIEESDYSDIELSEDEIESPDEDNEVERLSEKVPEAPKKEGTRQLRPLPARFASMAAIRSKSPVEDTTASSSSKKPDLKITDRKWSALYKLAQEKRAWMTPVHAEGQNRIHHILRAFDMTEDYGPCTGITRLERWERASKFGLNPPPQIRDILLTKQGLEEDQYSQSVLHVAEVGPV